MLRSRTLRVAPWAVQLFIILCIVAAALRPIEHSFRHEFFLEPDSIGYLALGSDVYSGRRYTLWQGDWCSDWPPLYPLLLGDANSFLHDDVYAAGVISAAGFGVSLLLAFLWMKRADAALVSAAALALIAFSQSINNLYNSALSETVFIPLCLASIICCDSYCKTLKRRWFYLSSAFAVCSFFTRYTGSAMVVSVLLSVASARQIPLRRKLLDMSEMSALMIIPIAGWCALNIHQTGTPMGDRDPGGFALSACTTALFSCMSTALGGWWISGFVTAGAVFGSLVCLTKRASWPENVRTGLIFLLLFGAITIYSSSHFAIDMVDDRLTSPMIVPALCVCVSLIGAGARALPKVQNVTFSAAAAGIMIFGAVVELPQPQVLDGGYLNRQWQLSPTLRYVRRYDFNSDIYSNDPAATYFIGHKTAIWIADESDSPTMSSVEVDIDQIPNGSYLIWYYNSEEPSNFNPDTLAKACGLQIEGKFDDGAVFRREDRQTSSAGGIRLSLRRRSC